MASIVLGAWLANCYLGQYPAGEISCSEFKQMPRDDRHTPEHHAMAKSSAISTSE
jgi:hypothetical protein